MINNLRYLIVNADDFGLSDGVTEGILQAHLNGIVTSTSVMMTMDAAEASIQRALEEAPSLGMGVHLTLTAGRPLSDPTNTSQLVRDDGLFIKRPDFRKRVEDVDIDQVEREFRAQILRFQEIAGQLPDHLDSHHHVTYTTAAMFNLMLDLAEEFNIPVRRGYSPDETSAIRHYATVRGITDEGEASEAYYTYLDGKRAFNVPTTDDINLDYYGRHTALGDLLLHLVDLPEGVSELMCHPGQVDAFLENNSSYVRYREQELGALTQRSARELCTAEGIVRITFGQLANVSTSTE